MFIKNSNGYVDLSLVKRAEVGQTGRRLHGHGEPSSTRNVSTPPATISV
jgi:hypothetical protein